MYYRITVEHDRIPEPMVLDDIRSNELEMLKYTQTLVRNLQRQNCRIISIRIDRKVGLQAAWKWFQSESWKAKELLIRERLSAA